MANELTLTQLVNTAPDIVRAQVLIARYAAAKVLKKVLNADKDVAAKGDRVSIPIVPKLTVNAVGSGGTVTRQNPSTTEVEIVVDKWNEVTVDIEDKAEIQSAIDAYAAYTAGMGAALGEQQDKDLLALHSSLTTNVVGSTSTPTSLDDAMVRLARLKLDRANVPEEDRCFILHPDAEADLLAMARFSEAQNTGFARGLQIDKGRLEGLYGIPVLKTTLVVEAAGPPAVKKNLLLHQQSLGIATQRNFKLVPLAKVQLSEAVTAHILYGVKLVRNDHGAVINSAPNA